MDFVSRRGLMLVLSSPSGVGKTTISKILREKDNNLQCSISVTTRQPRDGEVDGVDYHFVDEDEFDRLVKKDSFLEYAKVFKNYYGTLRSSVEDILQSGKDVLFDIDWQGNVQLAESAPRDLVSVFILPPSMQELRKRLFGRGLDSDETIAYRMKQVDSELLHCTKYDYVMVNNSVDVCVQKILTILAAERSRRDRQNGLNDFIARLRAE